MYALITSGRGLCLIIQGIALPCTSTLELRDLKVCVFPRYQWEGPVPHYSRNSFVLHVHIGTSRCVCVCVCALVISERGPLPYYSRSSFALHILIGNLRPQSGCVPSPPVGGACCLIIQGIALPCMSHGESKTSRWVCTVVIMGGAYYSMNIFLYTHCFLLHVDSSFPGPFAEAGLFFI